MVQGRKTGIRTLVHCSGSCALFQYTQCLRENETQLGVFVCPLPSLLVLNRPEPYRVCQVLD